MDSIYTGYRYLLVPPTADGGLVLYTERIHAQMHSAQASYFMHDISTEALSTHSDNPGEVVTMVTSFMMLVQFVRVEE